MKYMIALLALAATAVAVTPGRLLHPQARFYPNAHHLSPFYPHDNHLNAFYHNNYQPRAFSYPNVHHPSSYFYNQPYSAPTRDFIQPTPQRVQRPIAILKHAAETNFDGSFFYDYDTENGISAKASGQVKNLGTKEEAQVMQGSYSYTGPDGIPITTNWVADEFGFRAEGAHLPTPPPIPEEIARSIEYNRAHPQPVGIEAA